METRDTAKHPTLHGMVPQQRVIGRNVSRAKLRNPALNYRSLSLPLPTPILRWTSVRFCLNPDRLPGWSHPNPLLIPPLRAPELPVVGGEVETLKGAQQFVVAKSQVLQPRGRVCTQTLHAGDQVAIELQHLKGDSVGCGWRCSAYSATSFLPPALGDSEREG